MTTRLLPATMTPMGSFTVRPVDTVADLPLLHAWMNDPAVARYWELDGPVDRLRAHLEEQHEATHTQPYIGLLDGLPMSYWELYRADLDRLAGYYDAQPGDAGVHLLLGPAGFRGLGLGWRLIRTLTDWQLGDAGTRRVVAEPDVRNVASLRAFERAGFVRSREIELPEKTAALMVRTHD